MLIRAMLVSLVLLAGCGGTAPEPAIVPTPDLPPLVVIEGDSLASPPWATWPAQLQAQRPTVTTTAAGGRTAAQSLEMYLLNIGTKPAGSVLVLVTGTNDLVRGRSGAHTAADVLAIWSRARAQGLQVIGATVASVAMCTAGDCERERQAFNAALIATGMPLLRLDLLFPDTTDARFYLPDRTHYTPEANALISDAVGQILDTDAMKGPRP